MEFEEASQLWKQIKDFDPLDTAEKLTGEPLSTDGVGALGFLLLQHHAAAKREALEAMGDFHSRITYSEAQEVLIKFGFSEVFSESFEDKDSERTNNEHFKMFWNPMGILVTLESYWNGKTVNSCHAYFNWRSNDKEKPFTRSPIGCSGGIIMKDDNWMKELTTENFIGWHCGVDGREGLISLLMEMFSTGSFFPKWAKAPHLWFINFAESHNKTKGSIQGELDYFDKIRNQKFKLLPPEVQEAIGDPSGETVRNL